RADGDFDGKKHTIPAELFPKQLDVDGVPFAFGPPQPGARNILVPAGQTIALPAGKFNRVYVLASAVGGDLASTMTIGGVNKTWVVSEWQGPIGQWWSRLKDIAPSLREPFAVQNGNNGLEVDWDPKTGVVTGIDKIHPAFVKRDEVAWIATHRHDPKDNEPYVSAYVFKYGFDLPAGTRELKLPNDSRVRIFAISVVDEANSVTPASALYLPDFPSKGVSTETLPTNRTPLTGGKGAQR
ncbi:MAG TPA: hypothetical protein VJN96_11635, partial [Vicinamibacterales bacterium]|nr:hypothetical protein [Vicinamibacterales bacterium]